MERGRSEDQENERQEVCDQNYDHLETKPKAGPGSQVRSSASPSGAASDVAECSPRTRSHPPVSSPLATGTLVRACRDSEMLKGRYVALLESSTLTALCHCMDLSADRKHLLTCLLK
ncbi:hypothetical protein CB1_001616035 [Camelus ferus]|nr:hypothetical protein CB1_001616035 [Camelus ferus]